jgi:hypothetical protein
MLGLYRTGKNGDARLTSAPDAEPGNRNNQFAQLAYDHSQMARYMEGARSRHVSDALMREIYLRDNGTCQKCSRAVGPRAAHFDHIIPWSEDGDTVPWNLQVLCESCNLAKGNRMDDQDYEKLAELDAITWMLYALMCITTEQVKYIRGLPGLDDDTRQSAVRGVVQDARDLLEDLESRLPEGARA